ncbi:MAG: tRNA (adenine-N1)-methyltransferase, partial [Actinomycetota bacterium]
RAVQRGCLQAIESTTLAIIEVSGASASILRDGERVLLVDGKDRRYLITLTAGRQFHTHSGILDHDSIIGAVEGSKIPGSTGRAFLVLRPTLTDVVLKMPRGAQVIYPKDLGAILIAADLAPGQRVLEAGVGSGALSIAALRAGVSIIGYEIREDFAEVAKTNVYAMLGPDVPYDVKVRDVTEGIDERDLDRILLDMPEPDKVVPHAAVALRPGGIFMAYLPTINQTALVREALDAYGFGMAETVEILRRTWHIEGRSIRPDHRMVAHTGFLTFARRLVVEEGREVQFGQHALFSREPESPDLEG